MSYFSNHPEDYDTICRRGIINHLQSRSHVELAETELWQILDFLQDESRESKIIYSLLEDMAHKEIDDAERDYFADLADKYHRS